METKLYIRNMVCDRCRMVVRTELEKENLVPLHVSLGEVILKESPTPEQLLKAAQALEAVGFELIDDRRTRIIEKIKNVVVSMIHYTEERSLLKQSEYIAGELGYEYHYLSKLFSESEGITIEQFAIQQKVERAKELLSYGELSLNEIADQLGYSSVQHLSQQFRKVTGMTATAFRNNSGGRKPLDKL